MAWSRQPQDYVFQTPALDTRQNPALFPYSQPGQALTFFPRLVGIDGREQGKLRRFRGFYSESNWDIPSTAIRFRYLDPRNSNAETTASVAITIGGQKGTKFFQYFAIQKDVRTDPILRGWLFLARFTDATVAASGSTPGWVGSGEVIDCLVAHYYDTGSETWLTEIITEFTEPYRYSHGLVTTIGSSVTTIKPDLVCYATGLGDDYFNGWTVDVWDFSAPALLGETTVSDSTGPLDTGSPGVLTQSATYTTAVGDGVWLRSPKVVRGVDQISVTTLGRHLYIVGTMSDSDGANVASIERMLRCKSTYTTDSASLTSQNVDAYSTPFMFSKDGVVGTLSGHWSRVGDLLAVDNGSTTHIRRIVRSTQFCRSALADGGWGIAAADGDLVCLGEKLSGATDWKSKAFTILPNKWASAPIRPGALATYERDHLVFQTDLPQIAADTDNDTADAEWGRLHVTEVSTGGKLEDGNYVIAYRLVAPEQNWYSSLSNLLTFTVTATAGVAKIVSGPTDSFGDLGSASDPEEPFVWPAKWANFHTRKIVQLFRSTKGAVVPGTSTPNGVLFLESEVEITSGQNVVQLTWGTLADEGLTLKDTLRAQEASALTVNPTSKFIQEYENLLFWGTTPTNNDFAVDLDTVRWSPADISRLNYLPTDNRRLAPDFSSSIRKLLKTGSFLAILSDNEILRVHRSGASLAIDTIHNRHGTADGADAIAVGNTIYFVSTVGLLTADLRTDDITTFGAISKRFWDTWRNTLSSVKLAYDSTFGCLVCLNVHSTQKNALLIWMEEGVATELKYVPWGQVAMGSDPEDGGAIRAWFLDETTNRVYRMGGEGEASTETMCGGDTHSTFSYNPVLAGTHSTTQVQFAVPAHANVDAILERLVGQYICFHTMTTAASSWTLTPITGASRSGTTATITFASGVLGTAPVNGDTISLSPIVVEVVMPPVTSDPTGGNSPFVAKQVLGMQVKVQDWTAGDGGNNQVLVYRVYDEDLDTPIEDTTVAISLKPEQTGGSCAASSLTLLPAIALYNADCPLSLVGARVNRTITDTPIARGS